MSILNGQNLQFKKEIGNFRDGGSLDVDLNGNIYVSDLEDNDITKLDSAGRVIATIGGYGWNEASFDAPVSIITNTLSVYVADKNNDRVQRFDKDLNFLSLYNGRDNNSGIEFAYPITVEISSIGDLYILESDNNRILKFSLTGEYLTEIGGNDAGIFALSDPKDFQIDHSGNLYVLDKNNVKIFDQYGNGQNIIKLTLNAENIAIHKNLLLLTYGSEIHFYSLKENKMIYRFSDNENIGNEKIVDLKTTNNDVYILLTKRILKYKILN
jgi:hypothetical protein